MNAKRLFDTIVCFPLTEWEGLPHNSRHLMVEASRRGYRVVYVDPIGIRSLKLKRRDLSKVRRRVRQLRHPFAGVADGVWRLAPIAIPFQGRDAVRAINNRMLTRQIRAALRKLGAKEALLWSYSPQLLEMRLQIDFELAIYHRTDPYTEAPGIDASAIAAQEERAVTLADLCIAANRRSGAEAFSGARNTLVLPNGIDLSVFGSESRESDPIPDVGHPRLVAIGTIDSWTDLELLNDLALAHDDWQLVLAGDSLVRLGSLSSHPRVHVLGRLPYEQLPALLAGCDVGLVPWHVNAFTTGMCPGKIYQYLAAGLPVLSTPMLEPSDYDDHVSVAPGEPERFGAAIEELLRSNTPDLTEARRGYARRQTYAARFDEVETALGLAAAAKSLASPGSPAPELSP
jgi:glycosyltransferase involved in cell wall biosynthesis